MDYSKLSDEQLVELVNKKKLEQEEKPDYSKMTDDELASLVQMKIDNESDTIGNALKEAGSNLGAAALSGIGKVGEILDYPFAPAREFLGTSLEAILGKKEFSDIPERTLTPIFEGAGSSRSWDQILQDLGVQPEGGPAVPLGVEEVMTEQEKQMAPKFQTTTVGGSMLESATPLAMKKIASKIPIPDLIDREAQAAKAMGMSGRQLEKAESLSPQAAGNITNLTEYGKDSGIISPFSSRKAIVEKASKKMEEAGSKIGQILKKSNSYIDDWLLNASPSERKAYLNSGFNIQNVGPKMMLELSNELEGGPTHDAALRELKKWLEKHDVAQKGIPDIEQMQKWKKNIGKGIKDWTKFGSAQPAKEAAYTKIYKWLDKAIENEIDFAEKYLKGSALDEYKIAKREFSQASAINKMASSELAKERISGINNSSLLDIPKNIVYGARTQSALANLPKASIPYFPKLEPVRIGASMMKESPEMQMIDQALQMGVPPFIIEDQVKKMDGLKPTEKAQLRQKAAKAAK